MVGEVILRQIMRSQVKKVNKVMTDLLEIESVARDLKVELEETTAVVDAMDLAEEVKQKLLDASRELGEIISETWEVLREKPVRETK